MLGWYPYALITLVYLSIFPDFISTSYSSTPNFFTSYTFPFAKTIFLHFLSLLKFSSTKNTDFSNLNFLLISLTFYNASSPLKEGIVLVEMF